jgi:hypothetical protein
MGFFGAIGAAIGAKSSKMKTAANGLSGIFGGSQIASNKPVATDHTHSSDNETSSLAGANMGPVGGDGIMDAEERNDNFMGRNKNISGMEFGDVTRGGRTIDPMVENNPVQTAGNFSPLGTPDFVPREDSEEYGKQFIS